MTVTFDATTRPEIVCLCGSTRFYAEFAAQNLRLTLAGAIVLSIGCDTKSDGDLAAAGTDRDWELRVRPPGPLDKTPDVARRFPRLRDAQEWLRTDDGRVWLDQIQEETP